RETVAGVKPYNRIVRAGRAVSERPEAERRITGASGIVQERLISIGCIVIVSVAGKRLKSGGGIMVSLANRESLLTNRGVPNACGVVVEREKTVRCVSVCSIVVRKRAMAGRRVPGAGGVFKERISTEGRVGSTRSIVIERKRTDSSVVCAGDVQAK